MGFNSKQKLLCSTSISLESRTIGEAEKKDWNLSKCGATEESNQWIELQMKKFLEELEKEEPCGRV